MDSVDFIPVLLGTDANAYGMARSFYEEYGITSLAIGKGALVATANSKIVKVVKQEPRLEEDDIFVETLKAFASTHTGKKLLLVPCGDNYIKLLVRNQDKLKDIYDYQQWQRDQNEKAKKHNQDIDLLEKKRLKEQWARDEPVTQGEFL